MERIGSATTPASVSEEINQLRTTMEKLERERATSKSEVARQRNGDQSALLTNVYEERVFSACNQIATATTT